VEVEAKYDDELEFKAEFGAKLDSAIFTGLETLPKLELPIPPGSADLFPIDPVGLPLPILQGSIGLPFHTELTFRGLFKPIDIPKFGSIKYGGIGGKIGISDYLSDYLYPDPKKVVPLFANSNLIYIIEAQPSEINPSDVDNAISELRQSNMYMNELDSLNYLFLQGDTTVVVEIQTLIQDAQLQLEKQPKSKRKFPIDLALGFYSNDLVLELDDGGIPLSINSTNRIITLQTGKTLNFPSFLSFLGGIGIYGGLGYEISNLEIGYTLANPLKYGCFADETNDNYHSEIKDDVICKDSYPKGWHTGVPAPISLKFPGGNKFRKLIGARMRILFVDAYVDYNMGTSNSYNAGLGITFR
jgi:hypothetical protein